ncbi:lytic transglycosylase domain-containing protein [Cohnella lubricantis]|uniref:Lytic transglycosylase domain-containing protein n=1 Tax=Cohnella lubricantis TaxID=2163172 RepID=A0A841TAJ3_9BACL|nr:lytic transglycosylase domain-containing protein [Cohnella lubricantis]MBB6676047.1 lytic transglycosylase domain-containing protein [Cohnella lubricantis]MBP2118001.1 soluble lytic murein transglycosylase [Cohnella lubricantis]
MKKNSNAKSKRRRVVLLLLIIIVGLLFIQSEWLGRTIYPIYYKEEIKQSAELYELDPLLIASIIRVESNYKPRAVSPKGAIGIMQLMPDTAEWILSHDNFGSISLDDIGRQPEAGIRIGTWYMKDLLRQFDGNLVVSLAAYNAGPGKVRQWLKDRTWDGKAESVADIPYGETRQYVQKVLHYYNKYKEVHKDL